MFPLILANLWQKKTRTILTILGLAVATGTLFSLLSFERGYRRGLARELNQLGAHVLVVPKGCPYDAASLALHGASWPCYLQEAYLDQVTQTPGVQVAAPVFMAADYGAGRQVVVGITEKYLQLRPGWQIQGTFPVRPGEVLLGTGAARHLHAQPGGHIFLKPMKRQMLVSGILQSTGGPEDDFAFVCLAEAQTAFQHPGSLTHVLVRLRSPDFLEQTVKSLRGCDAGLQMNVVPLAHLFESIRSISASAKYLLAGLAAIAFLVAGTSLANTMLMAVLERTREIGVLRAIGASAAHIFFLILAETLVLGAAGAALGLAGALSVSSFIESWVRARVAGAPAASLIHLEFPAVFVSAGAALALSAFIAVLPALRASRLDPAAAFRAKAAY